MASVNSSASNTKHRSRGLLSTVNFKSVQRPAPSGPPPGIDMSSIVPSMRPSGLGRGRVLNTGESRQRVESSVTCNEVHVVNIPATTFERVLQKKFCRAGRVQGVKIIRSSNKTTYGFVRFSSSSEAEEAVRMMDGVLLEGSKLSVSIAKSRAAQAVPDPFSATSSEGETHSSKENRQSVHEERRTILSKTTLPSNTNCTSIARTKSPNNASPPTLATNKSSEHIIPSGSVIPPSSSSPASENGDCVKTNQTPPSLDTATQPSDAEIAGMPPLETKNCGRGFSRLLISKDKNSMQQRKSIDIGARTMSSPKPGRIGRGNSLLQLVQQHHTLPQEDVVSSPNESCDETTCTKPELTLSSDSDAMDSASTEGSEQLPGPSMVPPSVVNVEAIEPPTEDFSGPPTMVNVEAMEPPTVYNIEAMVPPMEDSIEPPTATVPPTEDSSGPPTMVNVEAMEPEDSSVPPTVVNVKAMDPPTEDNSGPPTGEAMVPPTEDRSGPTDDEVQPTTVDTDSAIEEIQFELPTLDTSDLLTLPSQLFEFNRSEFSQLLTTANDPPLCDKPPFLTEGDIEKGESESSRDNNEQSLCSSVHGTDLAEASLSVMESSLTSSGKKKIKMAAVFPSPSTPLETSEMPTQTESNRKGNISDVEQDLPVMAEVEIQSSKDAIDDERLSTDVVVEDHHRDCDSVGIEVGDMVDQVSALSSNIEIGSVELELASVDIVTDLEMDLTRLSCETTSPVHLLNEITSNIEIGSVELELASVDIVTDLEMDLTRLSCETTSPVHLLNEITSDEESSEDGGSGEGMRGRDRGEVEKSIATYQRNTHRWQTDLKRLQMKIIAMETGLEERHTEHAQTEVGPLEELSDQRQMELDTITRLESQYVVMEEQAKRSAIRRQQTLETTREQYSGDRTGLLEIELAIENEEARAKLELTKLKLKVLQLKEELYATLDS